MLTYRLSNRQRKELYVRGRPLCILVPLADPAAARRDPAAMAVKLLPSVDETIESASVIETTVWLPPRPVEGLSSVLGTIITHDARLQAGEIAVTMVVLRVYLWHGEAREKTCRPQWPGEVLIDGKPIGTSDSEARKS